MKQVMWSDTQGEMTAECVFLQKEHQYEVSVSYKGKTKTRKIPCSFTPYFGMDVIDQQESGRVAEELSQEHEKENAN